MDLLPLLCIEPSFIQRICLQRYEKISNDLHFRIKNILNITPKVLEITPKEI